MRFGGLALVVLVLLLGSPLQAVDLVVTTTDDTLFGPECSLRAALRANDLDTPVAGCPAGDPGFDRVLLPAGTYSLLPGVPGDDPEGVGDLDVTGPVEIVGAGWGVTTLQPAGGAGMANDRLFDVLDGGSVSLTGVTVRDGRADLGGGLRVGRGGELHLADCRVLANEALSGGGIHLEEATATIERCVVAENQAAAGGGIFASSSVLAVRDSRFDGNSAQLVEGGPIGGGGAIAQLGGSTQIETSEIVENWADDTRWGGGGVLAFLGNLTIFRSTLAENSATDAEDDGSVSEPEFDESGGGAISAWMATVRLENSTLSGNWADDTRWGGGGILSVGADVEVGHTTFWDNTADGAQEVGSHAAGGSLSAITRDIDVEIGRSLVFEASILAGASPAECLEGASGPPQGGAVPNAIGDLSCTALASSTGPVTGLDPLLADHGGPTRTHHLLPGSNAVDAGGAGCFGTDGGALLVGQRGVPRPQNGLCDLGAVERTDTVNLAVAGLQAAPLPEPGGTVPVDLTFDNPGPLPARALLEVAGVVSGLGSCGPLVDIPVGTSVDCQIELTVAGNAGTLSVELPVATSSPDATGAETLQLDLQLTDVLPSVALTATVKPRYLEEPGGEVTFFLTVTNQGTAEPIDVTSLTGDDGPLGGTCGSIGTLGPEEAATCSVVAEFTGTAGQNPTETLSVTFEDDEGNVGSQAIQAGPHILEIGTIVFQDCFESGDTTAWSFTVN